MGTYGPGPSGHGGEIGYSRCCADAGAATRTKLTRSGAIDFVLNLRAVRRREGNSVPMPPVAARGGGGDRHQVRPSAPDGVAVGVVVGSRAALTCGAS